MNPKFDRKLAYWNKKLKIGKPGGGCDIQAQLLVQLVLEAITTFDVLGDGSIFSPKSRATSTYVACKKAEKIMMKKLKMAMKEENWD